MYNGVNGMFSVDLLIAHPGIMRVFALLFP